MTVAEIIKRCKAALEAYYGPRFRGLVVYGSVARGEATPASDIDMFVLLSQPFDYYHELRQIVDLLYPIQLESDQLVSAKPAAWTEFERGSIQLYRKAKSEGVLDYGVTAHVSPGQAPWPSGRLGPTASDLAPLQFLPPARSPARIPAQCRGSVDSDVGGAIAGPRGSHYSPIRQGACHWHGRPPLTEDKARVVLPVFDTNVTVSAVLFERSVPGRAFLHALRSL